MITSAQRTALIGPDNSVEKFSTENDLKLDDRDTKRKVSTKFNEYVREKKKYPGLVARAIQIKTQHDMNLKANVNRVGGSNHPNQPLVNRGHGL